MTPRVPRSTLWMRRIACIGFTMAALAGAETPPAADALAARGAALQSQRDALESRYKQTVRDCYQQFNVTDCRNQARERYIAEHRALREQELQHHAQERQTRTATAHERLQTKQLDAADRAREAERASQAAQGRQQEQQRKQSDHDASGSRRVETLERQEDARAHRAEVERRARERERDKPRAAPLPSPTGTP